jgi:uncharacterized protein YqeY
MSQSSVKAKLNDDMKTAMRAKDKERLGVIRLALAALKQVEVDTRKELEDSDVIAALDKMVKQRRDSISQYSAAGRSDLAEKEQYEIDVLQEYLPAALSDAELEALIQAAIAQTGAKSMKEMGSVMGVLRPQVQGRADMGQVSKKVKILLG